MSPERTSPNGQYRTDWTRKGVGRIRVTYGYTLKDHAKAVAMLDEMFDNDQLDVLRALRKKRGEPGRITIKELMAAKKLGRHKRDDVLVDLRLQRPLWTTLEAMVSTGGGGVKHRRNKLDLLKAFAKSPAGPALGPRAVIADLRRVDWATVRPAFRSAAHWNNFRKALGSALTTLLEDVLHPFRREVMRKLAREQEAKREVDVPVEQFWALVHALPEHARPGIVTLAVTGMRLETEYMACTASDKRPELPAVYCPGSKTADAAGLIPVSPSLWAWVDAGIPAPLQHRWLREYFHRAAVQVGLGRWVPTGRVRRVRVRRDRSGPPKRGAPTGPLYKDVPVMAYTGITLHDLRHLALQFALDGGAQLNDVQTFARHEDPAMTMRYLRRAGRRRAADAIGRTLLPEPPAPTSATGPDAATQASGA